MANIFKNIPFNPTKESAASIIEKFSNTPWEFKEVKQYGEFDAVVIMKQWVTEETTQPKPIKDKDLLQ